VPTFVRHLRTSKISEAVEVLDSLYKGTAAYYASEQRLGAGALAHGCLPPSTEPFPQLPSADPQLIDYEAPGVDPTWRALGMHGEHSLRFSYRVIVSQPGCGPRSEPSSPAVLFQAQGDLDGDGVLSTIEQAAVLSGDQSKLEPQGPLHMQQRVE